MVLERDMFIKLLEQLKGDNFFLQVICNECFSLMTPQAMQEYLAKVLFDRRLYPGFFIEVRSVSNPLLVKYFLTYGDAADYLTSASLSGKSIYIRDIKKAAREKEILSGFDVLVHNDVEYQSAIKT